DNLLLAAPNASDEALSDMLRRVGLENLLEDSGLNSWLGEGGRRNAMKVGDQAESSSNTVKNRILSISIGRRPYFSAIRPNSSAP
ncbi:hypothetical protein MJM45_30660, partial [Salmonella enterica subsp. enterica serovar Kentucky]|nr:hypothetical protein [Salmonella enterica subsp. enterica serovar Kentucky]